MALNRPLSSTTERRWRLGSRLVAVSAVDVGLVGLLGLVTCVVIGSAFTAGEFWWSDESRHAMDGVFFLDVFRDTPWSSPLKYAYNYFAQYPALGLNWYPPFFALLEAPFFAIFGISEASAHLAILAFALVGMTAWYVWASAAWGRATAVLAALLFITNAQVVLWTRSVMLETPAIAMILLSALAFERYLARPRIASALTCGAILAAMLLLKQSTVFFLPALLLYAILTRRARLLAVRPAYVAYVLVVAALALLALHAVTFGVVGLKATVGDLHEGAGSAAPKLSLERWLLYPHAIVQAYGWPMLALAAVGIAAVIRAPKREDVLLFTWIGLWYVMATLLFGVPGNDLRYTMYALPAFALLASRAIGLLPVGALRYGAIAAIAGLIGMNGLAALHADHPYVTGYGEAARFVRAMPENGPVLFCCKYDGDFIFHVRAADPTRETVVLRADKTLVSMSIDKSFGVQSYVRNSADIVQILDRYGIGTVVVESRDLVDLPEFKLLLETVQGPRFRLLREIPVGGNLPQLRNLTIQVYEYLDRKPPKDDTIVIPFPQLHREIRFRAHRSD